MPCYCSKITSCKKDAVKLCEDIGAYVKKAQDASSSWEGDADTIASTLAESVELPDMAEIKRRIVALAGKEVTAISELISAKQQQLGVLERLLADYEKKDKDYHYQLGLVAEAEKKNTNPYC